MSQEDEIQIFNKTKHTHTYYLRTDTFYLRPETLTHITWELTHFTWDQKHWHILPENWHILPETRNTDTYYLRTDTFYLRPETLTHITWELTHITWELWWKDLHLKFCCSTTVPWSALSGTLIYTLVPNYFLGGSVRLKIYISLILLINNNMNYN